MALEKHGPKYGTPISDSKIHDQNMVCCFRGPNKMVKKWCPVFDTQNDMVKTWSSDSDSQNDMVKNGHDMVPSPSGNLKLQ